MSAISNAEVIHKSGPSRSAADASRAAFLALLLRDLTVLKKNLGIFIARTLVQPFLLVFVFLYVFPQIGEGVGGKIGHQHFDQYFSRLYHGLVIVFDKVVHRESTVSRLRGKHDLCPQGQQCSRGVGTMLRMAEIAS